MRANNKFVIDSYYILSFLTKIFGISMFQQFYFPSCSRFLLFLCQTHLSNLILIPGAVKLRFDEKVGFSLTVCFYEF